MPPTTIWEQFPLLAVVILTLGVVGGGLYGVARWVWGEWCKERDKDRAWREMQNTAREQAEEKRDFAWQLTVKDLAKQQEENNKAREYRDDKRDETLRAIVDTLAKISGKLEEHDNFAREGVKTLRSAVDEPKTGRRKAQSQ